MMSFTPETILSVLDRCCEACTFPMLDNGYVYLAATRLSLHRSVTNWAMVIEVFGFSPRAGLPDTSIHTFAERLHDRNRPESYVAREAYERYLANNPHNEFRSFFPIVQGPWQDAENDEFVAKNATEVMVRGSALSLPSFDQYLHHGVELEQAPRIQVFELCRLLADIAREQILATPQERRVSVAPDMNSDSADRRMASPQRRRWRATKRIRNVPAICSHTRGGRRRSLSPLATTEYALAQLAARRATVGQHALAWLIGQSVGKATDCRALTSPRPHWRPGRCISRSAGAAPPAASRW